MELLATPPGTALDRVVRDGLRPLAFGTGALFLAYGVGHVMLLGPDVVRPLAATALATAVLLVGLGVLLGSRPAPPGWAQPIVAGIGGVVLLNGLLHLALTAEPRQTTDLALLLVAAGMVFLSWRWLAAVTAATWIGWGAVVLSGPPSPEWVHFGFLLGAATALSSSVHAARLRAYRKIEELRAAELLAANATLREEVDQRRRVAEHLVRYARAVETCVEGIAITDLDGTIREANASLLELCGAGAHASLIGGSLLELLVPEDRARAREQIDEALRAGSAAARGFRLRDAGGSRRSIETSVARIADEDGAALGLVAVLRDVTERNRMQAALRHSEAFFRALIESGLGTIFVLDEEGTIIARPDPDASTVGQFGRRRDEVVGRFAGDFVHPEDLRRVRDALAAAAAQPERPQVIEVRLSRPDGSWATGEAYVRSLLHDPAVGGIVCSIRDISERKRAEDDLRRAKEAAEAASQAKSEFLATISHELRSPLHAIIGYADLLREQAFGPLAREQDEALECIRRSAHTQAELVSALLDLSAMDAQRLRLSVKEVRLADLLAEVAVEVGPDAAGRGLELVCRVAPGLPAIQTDPGKVKVILKNLASNAIKFTARGAVVLEASPCAGGVEISVADTGIGIPAEARELIFEPFRQLDGTESRRYGGVGLGLHIVKRLLALLGGSIGLESEVGRGSVFRVLLPVADSTVAGPPPGEEVVDGGSRGAAGVETSVFAPSAGLGALRVLVADDMAVNRGILEAVLRRLGVRTDGVANGREAVEAVARTSYDLVFMDLQMPELDGLAATVEIRRAEPPGRRVPIVAVTANAVAGDRERCLAAGMDDYLAKPVRPKDVREALARWTRPAAAGVAAEPSRV